MALLAMGMVGCGSAWAARPLITGFSDGAFDGPNQARWLKRAAAAGAGMVRISIGWDAPQTATRPAGFDARNPADPNYDFRQADAAIRDATRLGLRVLLTFTGAPRWAEGPGRPADAAPGSWRPDPKALEDYGVALGRRYSGHFPDPANPGASLPRVEAFQVWNEPNLADYLSPQWSGGRPASPSMYRAMLNAFYRGLKSADPSAQVVTAGTAPFGDPQPGGDRIQPVRFWRGVLCLRQTGAGSLQGTRCPNPPHFDVFAHHLYSWGTPRTRALWADDVAIPDVGKLTRVLRAAERWGHALPRIRHPLWITEVGYNSSPPNPHGVPIAEQARWLEQTLAELWREGAAAVIWQQVGDQPPDPSYEATSQSGVYYLDGRPKPALEAFRFPLVAWSARSRLRVWGRTPSAGRLVLEELTGRRWHVVFARGQPAHSIFVMSARSGSGPASLRARIGSRTSLVWHVG